MLSTLLCVSLPVARLLPPLWLSRAQTDGSPTAAPAHCFNMFWQRTLYHSSRRPSAARSMKLKCASWLWSFGCCSWLLTKAIWPTGGSDLSLRPDVFYITKERKGNLYRFSWSSLILSSSHANCYHFPVTLFDHTAFSCDAAWCGVYQLCPQNGVSFSHHRNRNVLASQSWLWNRFKLKCQIFLSGMLYERFPTLIQQHSLQLSLCFLPVHSRCPPPPPKWNWTYCM